MIDSFLAKVISYSSITKKGKILPLVILVDGTQTQILDAKSVFGITPQIGDTVLVLAIRNNLDDKALSIYYDANWSNCRIIAVASNLEGKYFLTGDYDIDGDLKVRGNLDVTKDITVDGNMKVIQDITVMGDLKVNGVSFNDFHSEYLAHIHTAPGGLLPAPTSPPL